MARRRSTWGAQRRDPQPELTPEERQAKRDHARDERAHGKRFKLAKIIGSTTEHDLWIRVDTSGRFHGEYPIGVWHSAATPREVEDLLRNAVTAHESITWSRWIRIDYSTRLRDRRYYDSEDSVDGAAPLKRAQRERLLGFTLSFWAFEVSSGNRPMKRYVRPMTEELRQRAARGDGEDQGAWWVGGVEKLSSWDSDMVRGAIPFTEARYAALCAIRDGLVALDERIREVIRGDADTVGARLEEIKVAALLPAPSAPPWNECHDEDCGTLLSISDGEIVDGARIECEGCGCWYAIDIVDGAPRLVRVRDPDDDDDDDEDDEDEDEDVEHRGA